jgi:hypothetical protein
VAGRLPDNGSVLFAGKAVEIDTRILLVADCGMKRGFGVACEFDLGAVPVPRWVHSGECPTADVTLQSSLRGRRAGLIAAIAGDCEKDQAIRVQGESSMDDSGKSFRVILLRTYAHPCASARNAT